MERGVRSAGAATEMDAQSQSEIRISYRQKEERDSGVPSTISNQHLLHLIQRFSETATLSSKNTEENTEVLISH